jgi:hypothetical protein
MARAQNIFCRRIKSLLNGACTFARLRIYKPWFHRLYYGMSGVFGSYSKITVEQLLPSRANSSKADSVSSIAEWETVGIVVSESEFLLKVVEYGNLRNDY